jgi:hypothetical protein
MGEHAARDQRHVHAGDHGDDRRHEGEREQIGVERERHASPR